ncbi:tetratricopeptide repeat protein [Nodularia chucula]|uniref:tetratricopeptide repeat protein n=1 Tax=Nodularia chucula TaxID=3093667 RepID=UPI0039C62FA0
MNNVLLDVPTFLNFSVDDFSTQWVNLANKYNQLLFGNNSSENIDINQVINDFRDVFNQMTDDVNNSNRRQFCKALLNYCEISQDYRDWGNWIQQEISQRIDEDSCWLYCALGRYLQEKGQFKESFIYHEKGILASIEFNNEEFLAFNHLGAGITLQRSQKPEEAEWHLQQALDLFKMENNLYQQANALVNLGSLYDRFYQGKKAISSYLRSVSILKSIGNIFDLGRVLYSLGIAYLNVGNLPEAELTFIEGKKFSQETGNLYFLALIFYGLGWLEYKRGNFDKSYDLLEKAISNFNKTKETTSGYTKAEYPESEGNIYLLAGAVAIKCRKPDFSAAHTYLNEAENLYQKIDFNERKLANVLANKARIYEYSKDWCNAVDAFLKLLKIAKNLKSLNIAADAGVHLVRIHRKKSASLFAWLKLINNLGFYGIIALIKVLIQERERLFIKKKWHEFKILCTKNQTTYTDIAVVLKKYINTALCVTIRYKNLGNTIITSN